MARADQASLPVRKDISYGISEMNPSCDGADIARQQRYRYRCDNRGADQNLDANTDHPVLDGTQYDNQADKRCSRCVRDRTVTLKLKCFDTSNATYNGYRRPTVCATASPADGLTLTATIHSTRQTSLIIHESGERLFFLGTPMKLLHRHSRRKASHASSPFLMMLLRARAVCASSSLTHGSGRLPPDRSPQQGFSMDFGVEITGTNPERQGRLIITTRA